MGNENSVGLKMSFDVNKVNESLNKVIQRLDKTNQILNKIGTNTGFQKTNNDLKETNRHISNIYGNINKISSISGKLKLGTLVAVINKVGKETLKLIDSSASYIENLNLMQVAFQDTRDEAEGLVNGLADIFGLDESVMTRQLGYYRQIGNALSIDNKYADLLADNLLKMQLDMSSLYNLSFERSGEVLQASMAGQTKPIRGSTGADITQSTLQLDLDRLGIEKQVTNLNRAEKSILIYLSLERQLAASQGDLAKTINSTANQQKIFTEQTNRLSRALGNSLSPAFTKILTYANGFLMVIVELIEMFAKLVGFEIPEYDANSYGLPDYFDEVADSAGKANNKLLGLRGFDKINNIKTPTSSETGSGSLAGIVDKRLLDALDEYNLKIDGIQNKATQIRDTIMEWLGFTKKINAETGEITWKYDTLGKSAEQIAKEIGTNLGNALTKFTKDLNWKSYGKTIAKGLNIALDFVNSFIDSYSFIDLGKGIANLFNGAIEDIDWKNVGKTLTIKFKIMIESLYGFISELNWSKVGTAIGNSINGAIENINLVTLAKGFNKLVSGFFDALVNAIKTINWGNAFKEIINGFSELNTLGKTFIGYKLASGVLNLANSIRILTGDAMLSKVETLGSQFGTLGKRLFEYIKMGKESGYSTGKSIGLGFKYAWSDASKLTKSLVGVGGLLVGLSLVNDSMKDMIEQGATLGNTFKTLSGLATSFLSGFAAFGLKGGTISLVIAGLGSIISLTKNAKNELDNINEKNSLIIKEVDDLQTKLTTAEVSYSSILKDINDNVGDSIKNIDYASRVVDQLDGLVDANGKVIGSTEEVKLKLDILNEALGTEYEVTNGVITLNGKKIDSYKELKDNVQKYCEKLKAEIYLEAYKEKAIEATKKLIDLTDRHKTAQERLNGVTENIKKIENERNAILEKYGGNVDEIKGKDKDRFDELSIRLQASKTQWELWNKMVNKNNEEIEVYQGVIDGYTEAAALNAQGKSKEAIDSILLIEQQGANSTETIANDAVLKLKGAIDLIGDKIVIPIKATINTSKIDEWLEKLKKNKLVSTLAPALKNAFKFVGFAQGGFPEDGWFRASKGEYFGKFDDGTSYIANNKQITDGIRQATTNGMMDAFAMQMINGNKQNVNVTIIAEDDGLLNAIKFKEKDRDRQYGL